MNKQIGVTMLEMLVVVSIFALVTSFAVLNSSALEQSFNRSDAKVQIRKHLRRAQTQSANDGGRGIFNMQSGDTGYEFGYDYLTYDTSDPISYDTTPTNQKQWEYSLPDFIKVTLSTTVIFDSNGRSIGSDGELQDVTLTFYETITGSDVQYEQGCLSAIGVLAFGGAC